MAYTQAMGMTFWREFDRATVYDPAFMAMAGGAGAFGVQQDFRDARANGDYPDALVEKFTPRRDAWVAIADVQTNSVATHLGSDPAHLQGAFEDFGQGTLVDDDPQRAADMNWIHMMDGQDDAPPIGYHRWHASIRVIQLLGIGDAAWWEELDNRLGLAWGVQSLARPRQGPTANPPLAQTDLYELRDAWLPLSPEDRDRQYDLTGTSGFHPSPKQPQVEAKIASK